MEGLSEVVKIGPKASDEKLIWFRQVSGIARVYLNVSLPLSRIYHHWNGFGNFQVG